MNADIFISYASQDRKIAMTICSALEGRGFKCWISARDILPGENFQSAIVHAIRNTKILLLVFTANSNKSEEMSKELALASQNKLMVVPLRIEDVAPNDAFAYEFATRQWIDFFADWELAITQLADRIDRASELLRKHAAEESAAAEPAPALAEPAATADAEAPPPAPAVEPEPRTFAAAEAETDPDLEEGEGFADEPAPRPRRVGMYAAVSVFVLALVGAGVLATSLRHPKAPPTEPRAMVVLPQASSPDGLQKVSAGAPASAVEPPPEEAAKATVKRKKKAVAKTEDEVPY